MDWNTYKQLCERADCFSRFALELTRSNAPEAYPLVSGWLSVPVLDKPDGHRGGPETDCFFVDPPVDIVSGWLAELDRARGVTDTATSKRLAHLQVVWREYIQYVRIQNTA